VIVGCVIWMVGFVEVVIDILCIGGFGFGL